MAQQKGSNTTITIGFESTYGTAASDGFTLPVNTCDVVARRAKNQAATLQSGRNPVQPFSGNWDVSGNIVVPCDSAAMIYWLTAMFSDPITTGSNPYVHEFKIKTFAPSFTLEKAFTDLATAAYERLLGCKIASFGMTVGGDGELVCTLGVLGASGSFETSAFDASPTSVTIARVSNFQAALTEGGATLSNATELSLNIDFGLDGDQFVIGGEGKRGAIPEGTVGVSGTLTTLFENTTLYTKALNTTESSLKLTITGSASSVFEMEIQELEYAVNGVPVDGPQGLRVALDFQGFYGNGSEASAIVARVTNATETYGNVVSTSASSSPSTSPSASISTSPSTSVSSSPS
jgi:hypothetical protein